MENRYKLKEFFGVPNIIEEARKSAEAKAKPGKKPGLIWILTLLISIGLMIVSEIVMIFPIIPLNLILKKIGSENPDIINSTVIMGIQLYLLIIITIIHCLYVRFIEKRKLRTIGFVKKGAAVQYLIGLGIGFGIFKKRCIFNFDIRWHKKIVIFRYYDYFCFIPMAATILFKKSIHTVNSAFIA